MIWPFVFGAVGGAAMFGGALMMAVGMHGWVSEREQRRPRWGPMAWAVVMAVGGFGTFASGCFHLGDCLGAALRALGSM